MKLTKGEGNIGPTDKHLRVLGAVLLGAFPIFVPLFKNISCVTSSVSAV